MEHIFICYSHKDKVPALQLQKALEEFGKDVWIDTEDLPAASIWREKIQNAIIESVAFIYLVSEDSLSSGYCKEELKFAQQKNKRIFPILLPNISIENVPATISERQWLIWDRSGEKLPDINKLIKDIETDHDWVAYHTELGVKSLKWEKDKDSSRLLRGKELQDVEQKLTTAGSQKDPQPTDSQRLYVFQSRKRENLARRQFTFVLLLTLVIVVSISFVALIQRNNAISQQSIAQTANTQAAIESSRAEEKAEIALAQQLAAQSLEQIRGNRTIGLLLSVEAFKRKNILETNRALYSAWINTGLYRDKSIYLYGHTGGVTSIAWSKDGQRIASGSWDNTVIIWDTQKIEEPEILTGNTSSIQSVAWSDDGRLASGSWDGTVIIWDIQSKKPAQILKGHNDPVNRIEWSSDGRLASSEEDGSTIIWDLQSGEPAQLLKNYSSASWSDDGRLATIENGGEVVVWDKKQVVSQTLIGHSSSINDLDWSTDGILASSGHLDEIIIWNIQDNSPDRILEYIKRTDEDFLSIKWSNDGRLASGSFDGEVVIWDIESGQPTQTFTLLDPIAQTHQSVQDIDWSKNGLLAVTSGNDITIWNENTTTWMKDVCQEASRNMTMEEWKRYLPNEPYMETCANLSIPLPLSIPHDNNEPILVPEQGKTSITNWGIVAAALCCFGIILVVTILTIRLAQKPKG